MLFCSGRLKLHRHAVDSVTINSNVVDDDDGDDVDAAGGQLSCLCLVGRSLQSAGQRHRSISGTTDDI